MKTHIPWVWYDPNHTANHPDKLAAWEKQQRRMDVQRIVDAILAEHDPATQIDTAIDSIFQNKPVL